MSCHIDSRIWHFLCGIEIILIKFLPGTKVWGKKLKENASIILEQFRNLHRESMLKMKCNKGPESKTYGEVYNI